VRFSPMIDAILAAASPMPLDAGTVNAALAEKLVALDFDAAIVPAKIRDRAAAEACLAGLWLRINDLDHAHRISQELETPEGSYWHAIVHRREGDYGNSKYWLRRVGKHPVFAQIASNWDPFAFVDGIEKCVARGAGNESELRDLQSREWNALFEFCWARAVG
jgi:hypothetical protein